MLGVFGACSHGQGHGLVDQRARHTTVNVNGEGQELLGSHVVDVAVSPVVDNHPGAGVGEAVEGLGAILVGQIMSSIARHASSPEVLSLRVVGHGVGGEVRVVDGIRFVHVEFVNRADRFADS